MSSSQQYQQASGGFFKFLTGDFSTKLLIPDEFARRYEEILPEKLHLKIYRSEEYSWPVKIEKMNNKLYYFKQGWLQFLKANQLKEGDVLVFEFDDRTLTFRVAIFDILTACEKEQIMNNMIAASEKKQMSNAMTYSFKLTTNNKYYLVLPADFVAKIGSMVKGRKLKLRDPSGKDWEVGLIERSLRTDIYEGWNEFVTGQKLSVGSVISIEFVPSTNEDVVFPIKVVKRGGGELFKALNKAMGRPPATNCNCF